MNHRSAVISALTTLRDYVRWGASRFNEAKLCFGHGTINAIDEAAALVLHALHQPHDLPAGYFNCVLSLEEREDVLNLLQRRIDERLPAAYLTGEAWFAGLAFKVDPRVLVPRSPIAELIEQRFSPWIGEPEAVEDILDLCTGSGCIAIACAYAFPDAGVDAVDISADALDVAASNVERHEMEDQVSLYQGDLFAAVPNKRYDIIVSNPPYVNSKEWEGLPAEFHAEPKLGLEAADNGLAAVKQILSEAGEFLKPEGILVVEVGSSAEALEEAYPEVPFCWLDFERGGDGVFLLTAEQLREYSALLS